MAYIRYRDVPYQRSTLISNDRLDYMENGIIAAESREVEVSIEDVDGLEAALNGKADDPHTHSIANVTGLQSELNGKADDPHTHAVANITGLQGILEDLEQRLAALEPEP